MELDELSQSDQSDHAIHFDRFSRVLNWVETMKNDFESSPRTWQGVADETEIQHLATQLDFIAAELADGQILLPYELDPEDNVVPRFTAEDEERLKSENKALRQENTELKSENAALKSVVVRLQTALGSARSQLERTSQLHRKARASVAGTMSDISSLAASPFPSS
ncbi:hypothetical protein J8273_4350 [Carpediemonas membranifera]|uniref:Uncharacterized protein n=1 Tax=Carpediemonas membranifera TaxID=201153 RepID=A0A8J6B2C9_9EUKA|nr:hypothetical protein J8273_4350 [Carpediemonas membranifera]|eukprot:KAG9394248.1 hypothetical protein J8273_4350 [Carpediemonas membranifera]